MRAPMAVSLALAVGLGLASCDKFGGNSRPTGQVVAKVGKDEITVLDLQTELGGYKAPDARSQKAAEQAALRAIIQRKIIADRAKKEKIDRSPEFARLQKRMNELLLARSWQERLVRAVPAPSLEEAQTFVTQHPDLYSARKIFTADGIRIAAMDQSLASAIKPLNTLEEVQALLTSRKIPFQSGTTQLDALAIGPTVVESLLKLPKDSVFVMPQGNNVLIARIRDISTNPVPNDVAVRHASAMLRAERTQQVVGRQANAVLAAAKDEVKYNKAYEPPPPPANIGGAPAAAPTAKPK